jgi:hypothetical protein
VGEGRVAGGGRRGDEEDVAGDLGAVGKDDRAQGPAARAQARDIVEDRDVGGQAAQERDQVAGVLLAGAEEADACVASLPPACSRSAAATGAGRTPTT